jgi:hypothetical protein
MVKASLSTCFHCGVFEATTGFEPVIRVLQTLALPLGHVAVLEYDKQLIVACHKKSGQRDSNS